MPTQQLPGPTSAQTSPLLQPEGFDKQLHSHWGKAGNYAKYPSNYSSLIPCLVRELLLFNTNSSW